MALIFVVLSCQTHEEPEFKKSKLVSANLLRSISEDEIKALFTLAQQFFPEVPDYSEQLVGGIKMYYLEYTSSYLDGEPIVLSGLVCAPDDASRSSMIVSIQNGTLVEHSKALSKDLDDPALLLMQAMAGLGYVVVIQDYIGFGASEVYPHPYHVKSLFQSTVRDMLMATQEMAESGDYPFKLSGELFLTGYSLGGWATLVSHYELEHDPLDGLTLLGSVCGAGAYDLMAIQEYLFRQTAYGQPYYIALLFSGYISVGAIQDDLSLFFNEPYASRIPALMDGEHSPGQINSELSDHIPELFSQRLLTEFDTHPNEDIPFAISENLYAGFQDIGADPDKVQLIRLEGADHSAGSMPMFLMLVEILLNED